jgi:hypothetical protein
VVVTWIWKSLGSSVGEEVEKYLDEVSTYAEVENDFREKHVFYHHLQNRFVLGVEECHHAGGCVLEVCEKCHVHGSHQNRTMEIFDDEKAESADCGLEERESESH